MTTANNIVARRPRDVAFRPERIALPRMGDENPSGWIVNDIIIGNRSTFERIDLGITWEVTTLFLNAHAGRGEPYEGADGRTWFDELADAIAGRVSILPVYLADLAAMRAPVAPSGMMNFGTRTLEEAPGDTLMIEYTLTTDAP